MSRSAGNGEPPRASTRESAREPQRESPRESPRGSPRELSPSDELNGAPSQSTPPRGRERLDQTAEQPITGAGGVVFDPSGRVLLLQHVSGEWVFPKGHLEAGESSLEAALREVAEEAGVNATCTSPERQWLTSYRNSRGELREITWFKCRTADTEVVITEDLFTAGAFFPLTVAFKRITHAEDLELLRRVSADGEDAA